jgi:signal peptidase I
MFGFFESQEKKMRDNAANWLELADKVYHFRRDLLTAAQVTDLQSQTSGLRRLLKERAGAEKLKLAIERLEEILRRTGGSIYPKSALVENIDFFLVAAIVILGIRTYFVQPFKIPTNSMWPTYNGMTPEVWQKPADAPGLAMQAARFVFFGAQHKEVVAPESGPITVPVYRRGTGLDGRIYREPKPARNWFIFPTTNREYTFVVNDTPVRLQVPEDFDFDWAFQEAFGITAEQLADLAEKSTRGSSGVHWVTLERRAERGVPLISFDIVTGDQLFVDRISYHFMRPQVGQGFVFRTGNIAGIGQDQYYVKRLIGTPGDRIEVHEPVLWRNGEPITGADAFGYNARREGKYRGYFNGVAANGARFLLTDKDRLDVPANSYFAMGDNSGNSADGRYWGFVPAKDVVGRPLFVYFPFTRHWGPAR